MKNKLIALIVLAAGFCTSSNYSQFVSTTEDAAGHTILKFNNSLAGNTSGLKFNDGLFNSNKENLFAQIKSDFNSSFEKSVNSKRVHFSILNDSTTPEKVSTIAQKEKSIWLGMAFSAVLPGAGEFYAKNYLKAAIFVAIEAGLWGTYYYFQHSGDRKTADFQNYANQHWDIHYYAQWLISGGFHSTSQINPSEQNWKILQQEIIICEQDPQNPFSHTLPDYGTQQFYELIGKYQEFEAGWNHVLSHPVDYSPSSQYYWESYQDPVWNTYSYSRQDANNYYNHGTTTVMIIILNHIASIADAAWTVSVFNKSLHVQTGVRLDSYITPFTYEFKTQPKFNLQVNF